MERAPAMCERPTTDCTLEGTANLGRTPVKTLTSWPKAFLKGSCVGVDFQCSEARKGTSSARKTSVACALSGSALTGEIMFPLLQGRASPNSHTDVQ